MAGNDHRARKSRISGMDWELSKFHLILFLTAALTLLLLPGLVCAQAYDNPALGQRPVTTHPQDYKPLGIRAGSFMLHPGMELVAQYIDNAFYTEVGQQSDTIFHIRPYISMQSTWSRHSFNMRLAADFARYQDFTFRDYEDYFFIINGRVDVKTRSFLTYGLDYMRLHEDLSSRDSEQGVNPTVYTVTGGSLGYDHTFNRLSVGLHGNMQRLDFDDALGFDDTVIQNQDRDRDVGSLRLRMGYQFKVDKQAFVALSSHNVEYKQKLDRNGYARSSSGYTASAGISFNMTGLLHGDVFVSYQDQSYDDPRLPNVSGWAGGMGLTWLPTQLTTVSARISSGVQETTNENSSGYLRTLYALRVDHELTRSIQLNGKLSYSDNDYQLIEDAAEDARTSDQVWMAGIGVNYFINRHFYLSASYDYSKLKSNVPGDDFTVNRFWLVVGMER
jgi:hypothetical protein